MNKWKGTFERENTKWSLQWNLIQMDVFICRFTFSSDAEWCQILSYRDCGGRCDICGGCGDVGGAGQVATRTEWRTIYLLKPTHFFIFLKCVVIHTRFFHVPLLLLLLSFIWMRLLAGGIGYCERLTKTFPSCTVISNSNITETAFDIPGSIWMKGVSIGDISPPPPPTLPSLLRAPVPCPVES